MRARPIDPVAQAELTAASAPLGKEVNPDSGRAEVAPLATPADDVVMVLFPRATWDAVVALAARMGRTPADTVGYALAGLRQALDRGEREQ